MVGNFLKRLAVCAVFALTGVCTAEEPTVQGSPVSVVPTLLEQAKTFLGTPYRHGGSSPKGFDCSGFVRFVFGGFGVDLGRSSASQAQQGQPVALSDIIPGDLLFFRTGGRRGGISHVGIYVGEGAFIHASSWGGRLRSVVKIANLDATYYNGRLVAARRLFSLATDLGRDAAGPADPTVQR